MAAMAAAGYIVEAPSDITVIDAHHHLWDLDNNSYPNLHNPRDDTHLGNYHPICKNYLIDDYLNDIKTLNVVKSVHIEAGWKETDWEGETAWVQGVSDISGYPQAIIPTINLNSGDADQRLKALANYKNVRGVRSRFLSPEQLGSGQFDNMPSPLDDKQWRNNFGYLESLNLSFELQAPPPIMKIATEVAEHYPDTLFILSHAGLPLDRSKDGLEFWRTGMRSLARLDNVQVKISGLGMTDWNWTTESLAPIVHQVVDIFGPDKCLFGSNFPVDSLYASYSDLLTSIRQILSVYSVEEQHRILHENASNFYRI